MLTLAYSVSFGGMIVLPILLAFYLTRKFKLSWKLILAGALTFIASQVVHIPVLRLINPSPTWPLIVNALLLGLLAGIFEETARWVLYKFILKDLKTWGEGLVVGAGHGGVEAFILGVLAIMTFVNMLVLRNANISTFPGVSPDQVPILQQQVNAFWSVPAYIAILGVVERAFALCLHLSLSVMVLYSVAYKKPMWFWAALLWHALVDGSTVYLQPAIGALAVEGIVGLFAVLSLLIMFRMRPWFVEPESAPQTMETQASQVE